MNYYKTAKRHLPSIQCTFSFVTQMDWMPLTFSWQNHVASRSACWQVIDQVLLQHCEDVFAPHWVPPFLFINSIYCNCSWSPTKFGITQKTTWVNNTVVMIVCYIVEQKPSPKPTPMWTPHPHHHTTTIIVGMMFLLCKAVFSLCQV